MNGSRIQEAEGELAEKQTQHAALSEKRAKLERAVNAQASDAAKVRVEIKEATDTTQSFQTLAKNARDRIFNLRTGVPSKQPQP